MTGASKISLSSKVELFAETGCNFGELHPIATLYGMKLIFDNELMRKQEVLFNAGTHEESIAISPSFISKIESEIHVEDLSPAESDTNRKNIENDGLIATNYLP